MPNAWVAAVFVYIVLLRFNYGREEEVDEIEKEAWHMQRSSHFPLLLALLSIPAPPSRCPETLPGWTERKGEATWLGNMEGRGVTIFAS